MIVEMVKASAIKPASYNPRIISDEEFDGLKQSIKEFGIVDPFIINKTTGVLVGGHQRLKACIDLKIDEVPVTYVSLSPAKEKLLNIALNNPKISGKYTPDVLTILDGLKVELPEISLPSLRLDNMAGLIAPNRWSPNFDAVKNAGKNLDGIKHEIIIECRPEDKEVILKDLPRYLADLGCDDAVVR